MPHKIGIHAAGGLEQVDWKVVSAPVPGRGELLIRIEAAGAALGDVLLRREAAGRRFPLPPGCGRCVCLPARGAMALGSLLVSAQAAA